MLLYTSLGFIVGSQSFDHVLEMGQAQMNLDRFLGAPQPHRHGLTGSRPDMRRRGHGAPARAAIGCLDIIDKLARVAPAA
ncbi:hypothetical protein ACFV3F_41165 [Streptomyces sp. NPDC059717]|uniref:hypothetical protein n=1 Tax=Streptomyces sp. NPDC059717 TaxID=3346922 RepID=UPI00369EE02F